MTNENRVNESEKATPAAVEDWVPSKHVKLIIAAQAFVVFVVALDATILTTSLPTIATALNINATKTFWVAASYLLTSAVFQPLIAALADIFGRRALFFIAVLLFTVGTIICCTAKDVAAMLAGRSIQGIGGGGILSVNLIILSDLIPLRQRPKYQGYIQLVFALGTNLAPIIGGALVKHTTWRWLFYINLPFCGIGLVMIPFILRYERPATTFQSKLSSVDWIGSGLFTASITVFLIGISWGGNEFSWGSAATLCPLILGLAGLVAAGLYEHYGAKNPFLRLSLFGSPSAVAAYICTVLQALTLFAETYYLVFWLMTVKQYSPVGAGVALLALGLAVVPVSGVIGGVIAKVGSYQWAIWSGWVITTLGLGLLVYLDVDTSEPAWVFIFICAGIGQGLLLIALSVSVQAIAATKDVAYASGMYTFMRSLGLCLGVSLGGTIFQNMLSHRLHHLGLPLSIALNAEGYEQVLKAMAPSPEKTQILQAYAWAFKMLFATMTGISGLGLVLGFLIGRKTLDRALESEHRLRDRQVSDAERLPST